MKKYTISGVLTFCAFLTFGAQSFAAVAGQKHDLSYVGGSYFKAANEDETCVFCHTPHGAVVTDFNNQRVPLWNRSLTAGATYNMYASNTLNMTDAPSAPMGVSLLCMSCHDGVSAMNVLVNAQSITMTGNYDQIADIFKSGFISYPGANIGEVANNAAQTAQRNLSNDHPISFSYNGTLASNDGGLYDPGVNGANIAPLKLFNYGAKTDVLECATCHDPHNEGVEGVFLRMTNEGSQMCLTCHNK